MYLKLFDLFLIINRFVFKYPKAYFVCLIYFHSFPVPLLVILLVFPFYVFLQSFEEILAPVAFLFLICGLKIDVFGFGFSGECFKKISSRSFAGD